ncbi:MAG: ROK family protein [Bacteroidetes bacterium]|nr:ROK family protein [Bacteroidota bacterium]
MRDLNSFLEYQIFREFYYNQNISCAELSETLGKSIPVISKGIELLIKSGYLFETGYAPSSGGRRPRIYSLNPDKKYIVTVAMDQIVTKVNISNLQQKNLFPTETREIILSGNDRSLQILVEFINDTIERAGINREDILGVGIGMPGFINIKEGINYTYLPVEDAKVNLRDRLGQLLHLPVVIDNDSSVIALAELRFGHAKNCENVMVVNIGWGVGLGMIIDNQLFRGSAGYAGEFSHIPISESDKLCECGKRGCLETEATLKVIVDKAIDKIKGRRSSGINFEGNYEQVSKSIMTAANQGDPDAIDLLTDMAYKIGKGLAILVHIVNPELIVLSGQGANAGKILMAPIEQALHRFCIPRILESTQVKISRLGGNASLNGAAALVVDNYFILDKNRKRNLMIFNHP